LLSLLSDENFDGDIVRGLWRQLPDLDLVRVQDVGLAEADDPTILDWAASAGRILLTHDRRTMPRFARDRVRAGLPMPGVFLLGFRMSIGQAISQLVFVIECSSQEEWKDVVTYFPL
jgi:hypothetical protein